MISESAVRQAVLLVFVGGLGVCLRPVVAPGELALRQAPLIAAVNERVPPRAEAVSELLRHCGEDEFSLALAAECAVLQQNTELALELYDRLPDDAGYWGWFRAQGRAQRLERLGDLVGTEHEARRALSLHPGHLPTLELLGHLLQVEGRVWDGSPLFFAQIQRGKCRGDELLGMAVAERFFRTDERLALVLEERATAEPLMNVSAARGAIFTDQLAQAEALLRQVLAVHPDLGEAQGRLGRILLNRGVDDEFQAWRRGLTAAAMQHPEVWYVLGLAARQRDDIPGATRCYLEALALSPNHLGATLQVAGCLQQLKESAAAERFRQRADQLSQFESLISLARDETGAAHLLRVAEAAGELGRHWEAAGWCYVVTRIDEPLPEAWPRMRHWLRLARRHPDTPVLASALPQRQIDRGQFPLPTWTDSPTAASPILASTNAPDAGRSIEWRFDDDARHLGIDFTYYEGTTEANRLEHIYNVMGGGVGTFDYDLDGWPDLYLTQGNNWRDASPQPEWFDRLYRNQCGERFADVTRQAGLGDEGFSHGVTAGDFDQDGFLDVHVGNKGANRLYRNNGDGTFDDVTAEAGVAGNDWSTSGVFADFNGDALPDLFVINYTLIDETARKECGTPEQRKACTPDLLPPADDRCYINLGDGRFRDVSRDAGILLPDGKGLGIVAWDFDGNGRMDVFVANDTTPNYLFLNEGTAADGSPRFRDEGVLRGVAYDIDGNAQASMGVAAGDVTGDGRIDLCLTDFFGSAIDFYTQRPDGFFDDVTRPFGLREPSLWMLGFGCHFADFDGDGWDDLLVTNGHVDQRSSRGTPDRMVPQLFRNRDGRRFEEIPSDRLGPFFQQGYLGRGLALWDWNRDGRTDAAISHLHAPVAVVTNRTPSARQALVVRLIGRRGCREPTGTTVSLMDGHRTQFRLLTAGDGFLATNERRLAFFVESDRSTVDLTVTWPDGHEQRVHGCPASGEVVLVEDAAGVVALSSPDR